MIVPIPQFTAPSYGDRTLNEVQRCVNWYPEKTPTGWNLISYPGYSNLGTVPNSAACRWGYYSSTGRLYTVNGNTVYEVNVFAVASPIGTISTSSGHVYFADNGTQMLIVVEGINAYVVTMAAGTIALVVDANFPLAPIGAAFMDGYFIVASATTGAFYLSQLLDGMAWTPQQFATAESAGDKTYNLARIGSQLYLFGAQTIEPWYNTGNSDFPLERVTGGALNIGLGSTYSLSVLRDTAFFIGSTTPGQRPVYAIGPGGIRKISTPYIESLLWNQYAPGWYGFSYSLDGHDFYVIKNTTTGSAYGYDATSDAWLEISPVGGSYPIQLVLNVFDVNTTGAFAFSTSTTNAILRVSQATNSNTGSRVRIFGPIESNTKRVLHFQIRIELEMKFDATGATSIAPTLDWTDNGGLTYSAAVTMTKTVSNTTTGQRVILTANRLGSSASRYYRFTLPGAAKFVLKKCELDLREGRF